MEDVAAPADTAAGEQAGWLADQRFERSRALVDAFDHMGPGLRHVTPIWSIPC
jgi:hypothetical protein